MTEKPVKVWPWSALARESCPGCRRVWIVEACAGQAELRMPAVELVCACGAKMGTVGTSICAGGLRVTEVVKAGIADGPAERRQDGGEDQAG